MVLTASHSNDLHVHRILLASKAFVDSLSEAFGFDATLIKIESCNAIHTNMYQFLRYERFVNQAMCTTCRSVLLIPANQPSASIPSPANHTQVQLALDHAAMSYGKSRAMILQGRG